MSQEPMIIDESDYASEEDSDFAPDAAPPAASDESSASESEAESGDSHTKKPKSKPGKRKRAVRPNEEAEDVGFVNSGDEEIVEKGLKKQKKLKGKKGIDDEDEGGEGGFVKTRRMAALITEEKKPLATTAAATVDVDALWATMISGSTKQTADTAVKSANADDTVDASKLPQTASKKQEEPESSPTQSPPKAPLAANLEGEEMIMIQRTYNFAGKVHVEEKLVQRDSAEAKLWLQSQPLGKGTPKPSDPNITKPLRPPKKARRSIFEPMTEPLPQRTDLRFGVNSISMNDTAFGAHGAPAAKKLNTVEKSKMDWAGFVDKEGIKDELETAGKAKGAYLDQKEFLARVEEKREEEARRARLKAL